MALKLRSLHRTSYAAPVYVTSRYLQTNVRFCPKQMQCSNAGSVRSCSPRPRHRTSFRVSWTPSFPFPLKLSSFLSLLITTRLGSSSSPRSQASPRPQAAQKWLCVSTALRPNGRPSVEAEIPPDHDRFADTLRPPCRPLRRRQHKPPHASTLHRQG